ncbi:class I SAM-dependent methyltransferase [Sphingomonas parva]|uniref:Class I SAM-dependent methyltransferase n=1 Tax=Sphingomonas parva TaxID=2555898 RepID=A0A4Y8ZL80_9SPHN|nr:class I SAM-dependent methyltransferase [Sphingomonas parva]TFI56780.1 class I SAM-dependent methyltransferase [Sphingomonas parva]
MLRRFLAAQFARPTGVLGRLWIAPWLDRISRNMNALALAELAPATGERIVEIGFGGGALLRDILSRTDAAVFGVDVSAVAVARAERRFRREARLHLSQASVERLPLPDALVDAAVSVNSLYFWPDLAAAFAELARVIRPGGRLVLAFEPPEELRKWPGHVHGFRGVAADALIGLALAAGFEAPRVREGRGRKPDRFLCLSLTRVADRGGE